LDFSDIFRVNNADLISLQESIDTSSPAGLLFSARIREKSFQGGIPVETNLDFFSNASWLCSAKNTARWEKPDSVVINWEPAIELGGPDLPPWNLGRALAICQHIVEDYGNVRAPLVNADSLATALGRPNREQVMTVRASTATTLQALELTNGSELEDLLRRGAQKLLDEELAAPNADPVVALYQKALGRKPTAKEAQLAHELVGAPPQIAGLEDVLWSLTMLPEFQLIY